MTSRTTALLAGAAGFVFIIAASESQAVTGNMTVTATVVADCTLIVNALSFGAYVAGNGAVDGQSTITYDCAPGLDVDIAIGPSSAANAADGKRQMFNDNINLGQFPLKYDLYQDSARATPWREGIEALNISNTPDGSTDVNVYGRIEAGQQNVIEDTYQDTVVVTLTING